MGTEVTTATFHPCGNIPAVSRPDFSHMGTLRKPVCPCVLVCPGRPGSEHTCLSVPTSLPIRSTPGREWLSSKYGPAGEQCSLTCSGPRAAA